jgi:hypothetical protein
MRRLLLGVGCTLVAVAQLQAQQGPFGLTAGISKQSIEKAAGPLTAIDGQPYIYATKKVPNPLTHFENYGLEILPKAGLCQIRAIGVDVTTSSHGIELVAKFNELAKLLEAGYGKYERGDFLRRGSIWKEPEDWMMGLVKKERVLQGAWGESEGSTLKNQVKQILLTAVATRSDRGYLTLQYKFDNETSCKNELESLAKTVL